MKKLLAISLLLATTATAGEYDSVETKWRTCATCHGDVGQGKPGFPGLQTLTQEQIVEALLDYQNGVYRGDMSGIMFGQAATLGSEEVELIAKYIKEVINEKTNSN
jgi:cytochrome c553